MRDTNPSHHATFDLAADNIHYVYVVFFLADLTRDVTFRFASANLDQVRDAACGYLHDLSVPEHGFREFMLAQLEKWDGQDAHVTTTRHGVLVLMPTPFAMNVP